MEKAESQQRWLMLSLVSVAEMMAISAWLVSSAVLVDLKVLWELSAWQTGALTTAVQIGFVVGTLASAILNLADIWPNRVFFGACAILAATSNALLVFCNGFELALLTRFFVGVFMAGVYPPAMKMIATWFLTNRGFAIGTLIGALTLGKAVPFLLKTFPLSDWQTVIWLSSGAGIVAAILVLFGYRDGPHQFPKRKFSFGLIKEVVAHRPTRLAIGGYLGHMWELYAMWTWVGVFMAAAASKFGIDGSLVAVITFSIIASGAIGCMAGGWFADRFGRELFVNVAMGISGICCLIIGMCLGIGFWACAIIAVMWGVFVVADSAQFSTMVTEVSPQHAVGTALTLQTSIGFLLTTITIQLIPVLEESVGWQWAFAVLALGPVFGIISILKFKSAKAETSTA